MFNSAIRFRPRVLPRSIQINQSSIVVRRLASIDRPLQPAVGQTKRSRSTLTTAPVPVRSTGTGVQCKSNAWIQSGGAARLLRSRFSIADSVLLRRLLSTHTANPSGTDGAGSGSGSSGSGGEQRTNSDRTDSSSSSGGTRTVSNWLFGVSGLVFVMILLGGLTRLTRSGLSMVCPPRLIRWTNSDDNYMCWIDRLFDRLNGNFTASTGLRTPPNGNRLLINISSIQNSKSTNHLHHPFCILMCYVVC